jgi:Type II CAAX prenyl endopeptidase Rce1-like
MQSDEVRDKSEDGDPVQPGKHKLSLKEIVFLAVCLLGFVFYLLYDKQVFPSASIDMKLSQDAAYEKSKQFATTLGYDLANTKHVTTFTVDDEAKTVLEFKLGIDEANKVMRDQAPVWLWRTRFCKELSKDEMLVGWTTQGKLAYLIHNFENDKKLPTMSQDQALAVAKKFVADTAGWDLKDYELFERKSEAKPNRTDHDFVWRKPGYTESEYRVEAKVSGNQVSDYRNWLSPTNVWDREYQSIRQWNGLLGMIASLFIFLFLACAIGAFIYGLSRHSIRWRFVLIAGGVVAVLVFLECVNNFNYSLDSYDTNVSYNQFLLRTALEYVWSSLASFIAAVLIAGGAEVVYRQTRPTQTALQHLFTPTAMARNDFWHRTIMGYLIVGGMMFWTITYYKFGQKVGFFCPLGVDDYKVLGSFCSAISGMLIGVSAAGLEELSCRVVGLGLLQRWTKSFWLANLLQAAIWGFAHSTYPQQPCFARGIELTVVGLAFGYIVQNYGVLPCLVAHYLYDAFLTVQPVFASHDMVLIVPSLLILVPFVVAARSSRFWAKQKNLAVDNLDLTNAHEETQAIVAEHAHIEEEEIPPYAPMSSSKRKKLAAIFAVSLLVLLLPTPDQIGKDNQLTITTAKAIELSRKYLTDEKIDPADYRSAAQVRTNPDPREGTFTWQYIYERLGLEKTKVVHDLATSGIFWWVRYYKPLEPKGYSVYVAGDGRKRAVEFDDINEAAGAKLDEKTARELVESYISKTRPEVLPLVLNNTSKTVQAKRVDYEFEYLLPKLAAADTPAKLKAETKGDKLSSLTVDWEVPDTWLLPRKQQQWYQHVGFILRYVAGAVVVIVGLWWSVRLLRTTRVPWRLSIIAGLLWSLTVIIGEFNNTSDILMRYDTAQAFETYIAEAAAMALIGGLSAIVGCVGLSIAGGAALQNAFPAIRKQFQEHILLEPTNAEQRRIRRNIWTDAVIASYSFLGVFGALKLLKQAVDSQISPNVPLDVPASLAHFYSASIPALDLFTYAVACMIGGPLALALLASFWRRYLKSNAKSLTVIAIAAILSGANSWYWQDSVISSVFFFVQFVVVWLFVRNVFANNALACIIAAGEAACLMRLSELAAHASKIAGFEIALLGCLIALPGLLALLFWQFDRTAQSKDSAA